MILLNGLRVHLAVTPLKQHVRIWADGVFILFVQKIDSTHSTANFLLTVCAI